MSPNRIALVGGWEDAAQARLPEGAAHSRRDFCKNASRWLVSVSLAPPFLWAETLASKSSASVDIAAFERARILAAAGRYLKDAPITITSSTSPRSPGGQHDYYSEGDYFWPDPKNPHGHYIQRDGWSNPDNFLDHRRLLLRFSVEAAALTAAWRITGSRAYAQHAADHLRAWFIDDRTRMNPNLQYAQAARGTTTGSRFGMIDTIHLVEVVRATAILAGAGVLAENELEEIKVWFADYLQWMTTSSLGIQEMESKNNHATCWVMQVASFAQFTGNRELVDYARRRFQSVLVPSQMKADGSFPFEMIRTKPYAYSLFNLDVMATICQILSTPQENLWTFQLADGRGMSKAVAFMVPYMRDKRRWPLPPDVMYANDWPMRQCALLFAGMAFGRPDYLELWSKLPADSPVEEVVRNLFVRQPVLWV